MNIFSFAGINNQGADIAFWIIFMVLTVAAFALIVHFITKFIYLKKDAKPKKAEPSEVGKVEVETTEDKPKKKVVNQSVEEDKIEEKIEVETNDGENNKEEIALEETVTVEVSTHAEEITAGDAALGVQQEQTQEPETAPIVEVTSEPEVAPAVEPVAIEEIIPELATEPVPVVEPTPEIAVEPTPAEEITVGDSALDVPQEQTQEPETASIVEVTSKPEVAPAVEPAAIEEITPEPTPVVESMAAETTPKPTPEPIGTAEPIPVVAPSVEPTTDHQPLTANSGAAAIAIDTTLESETFVDDIKIKTKEKVEKQKSNQLNIGILLGATLGLGLILRLIFTFVVTGYRNDYGDMWIFNRFMIAMQNGNMTTTFERYGIYPFTALMFMIFGGIGNAASVDMNSLGFPLLFKLPFIIADLITAFILFRAAKKYINAPTGLIFAAIIMFFPLFIFASSIWGSVFSIYMMFLVLTFYLIAKKNYIGVIFVNSLALLTTRDALYIWSVVMIFIIVALVRYAIMVKHAKPKDFGELMRDKQKRNVVLIPAALLGSLIFMYLLSLPVTAGTSANPFVWFYNMFLYPLGAINNFGTNALNIFNLFLRNGSEFTAPIVIFSVLFAVVVVALVLLIYLSRKNRANLSFLAAFILITLSIFFMGFGAMNLVAPLGLLLLSFILIKDKRILKVFGLISFAVLFNGFAVMASAGYLNNLGPNYFTGSDYTGIPILNTQRPHYNTGGFMAISIIASVIVILTFAYAVLILLDISMSDRRRLLKSPQNGKFKESIINFLKK